MAEPSKAEKLAAAKRMLKEFQQKNKENTISTNSVSNSQLSDGNSNGLHPYQIQMQGNFQNGHSNIFKTQSTELIATSDQHSPVYTFKKEQVTQPAEQFFDNFTPPQPLSIPISMATPEPKPPECSLPVYNFYNPMERVRDSDKTETSSTSSRSEDDSNRRLVNMETQLMVEISRKEELQNRLSDSNEKLRALENEVRRLSEENLKISNQKSPLQEEIEINLKTIQILVSEKSELQQELISVQEENKSNKSKCEELSVRTRALRSQVAKLEQEIGETTEARQQHNSILKRLEQNLHEARTQAEQHRNEIGDSQDEIRALNRRVEQCVQENDALKKSIEAKDNQLSMAEVRIAQSGGGMPTVEDVDRIKALENECEKYKENIKTAMREKSECSTQFQEYINTLNGQLQLVNEEKENLLRDMNEKIGREEVLIRQLGELEKQMTKERQAGPSLTTTNNQLIEKLTLISEQLSSTESQLNGKSAECEKLTEELSRAIERLNEAEDSLERMEVPDAKRLEEAMESDRIAASRAIEQNTLLKQQIYDLNAEMSETVVRLNNEKLDLTERLQHAEYIIKELKYKMDKYKDKEEVTTNDSVSQTQLVFYMDYASQTDLDDLSLPTNYDHVTPEAMQLLEMKLKKTMGDFANLSDEKHRLEHLVTQLQGETETICEYVTLYQNQRGLLQEKARERERQLAALAKEREELKIKLSQINNLLPQAIPEEVTNKTGTQQEAEGGAASRIKMLLNEIESSSLVQDTLDPTTFHPCLVCSGKLITV